MTNQDSTSNPRDPALGDIDAISTLAQNGRTMTDIATMSGSMGSTLEKVDTMITIGKMKFRGKTDDLPQDWWFASTAIPLLAATIGPLANVLSIAALVSKWRVKLPNNGELPEGTDGNGIDIPDPQWEIILNAFSLGFGFFGNFCLLLNFTKRVRYIFALPATIVAWYFATGLLIGTTVAMNNYVPPIRPGETYSQGFWHAIIAAVLYLVGSMILMINMLGYFLGHYPQHFDLDDDQRTLILQTMMFFFWLAGGAGIFSKVAGFSYTDALYFCDVTVLTIGFGDFVAHNDTGRGLVFPYSVIGIIFLGLMINSIRKFASGMSKDKIIKKHQLQQRARTFGRTVTSEKELRARLGLPQRQDSEKGRRASNARKISTVTNLRARRNSIEGYGHFEVKGRTITFHEKKKRSRGGRGGAGRVMPTKISHKTALSRHAKLKQRSNGQSAEAKRAHRREKLLLLKEEKDRFEAMREIQANTHKFEKYWSLSMAVFAFGILWCIGALVFMYAEHRIQGLSYFEALYFCYVSLLTIGYGDFSPKSNAGKPFFIVWSLVAIPTMTILISAMGDTVVGSINKGTFTLADWTVMPKKGLWHDFLEGHPRIKDWIENRAREREAKQRLARGFQLQSPDEEAAVHDKLDRAADLPPTLETLAEEEPDVTEHELARLLAIYIKKVANDLRADVPKKYSYEEWVEFTRLIRFSSKGGKEVAEEEEEEGLVEWDWIGEDSPMLADATESEWVLERLCESLNRYTRTQAVQGKRKLPDEDLPRTHRYSNEKKTGVAVGTGAGPGRGMKMEKSLGGTKAAWNKYPAHPGSRLGMGFGERYIVESGSGSPVLGRGGEGDVVGFLGRERERERERERGRGKGKRKWKASEGESTSEGGSASESELQEQEINGIEIEKELGIEKEQEKKLEIELKEGLEKERGAKDWADSIREGDE